MVFSVIKNQVQDSPCVKQVSFIVRIRASLFDIPKVVYFLYLKTTNPFKLCFMLDLFHVFFGLPRLFESLIFFAFSEDLFGLLKHKKVKKSMGPDSIINLYKQK